MGQKGFTLLELMIIITIIVILASIAIPSFIKSKERQQKQQKIEQTQTPQQKKLKSTGLNIICVDGYYYLENKVGITQMFEIKEELGDKLSLPMTCKE